MSSGSTRRARHADDHKQQRDSNPDSPGDDDIPRAERGDSTKAAKSPSVHGVSQSAPLISPTEASIPTHTVSESFGGPTLFAPSTNTTATAPAALAASSLRAPPPVRRPRRSLTVTTDASHPSLTGASHGGGGHASGAAADETLIPAASPLAALPSDASGTAAGVRASAAQQRSYAELPTGASGESGFDDPAAPLHASALGHVQEHAQGSHAAWPPRPLRPARPRASALSLHSSYNADQAVAAAPGWRGFWRRCWRRSPCRSTKTAHVIALGVLLLLLGLAVYLLIALNSGGGSGRKDPNAIGGSTTNFGGGASAGAGAGRGTEDDVLAAPALALIDGPAWQPPRPLPAALSWQPLIAPVDTTTGRALQDDEVNALLANGTALIAPDRSPRRFRLLTLENSLKVLLIHDPLAPRAGAALSVAVGSNSDYTRTPGLAHFLEHMLFMGSEKYPEINEFSSFLSQHGGVYNAFTSEEETNYFFDISPAAFDKALDIFAQFLIAPLLSPSAVSKEIAAVDAEHSKNLVSDSWREWQVLRHVSDRGHVFRHFGTGDRATLSQPWVPEDLRVFHREHYRAEKMHLTLLSPAPLDPTEVAVVANFGRVPSRRPPRAGGVVRHPTLLARVGDMRTMAGAMGADAADFVPPATPAAAAEVGTDRTRAVAREAGAVAAASLEPVGTSPMSGADGDGADSGGGDDNTWDPTLWPESSPGWTVTINAVPASPVAAVPPRVEKPRPRGFVHPYTELLGGGRAFPIVSVEAIADAHSITMLWALPSQDERARTDPLGYVSYHLAQPHPGGVASFLKRRGWASKLEAEAFTEMRSAGAVLVQVALTPAGLNHIDDIIATVLYYISIAAGPGGVSRARFDDLTARRFLDFTFADREATTSDYVRRRATALRAPYTQPADVLRPSMRRIYNASAIADVYAALTAENMLVQVLSPTLFGVPESERGADAAVNTTATAGTPAAAAMDTASRESPITSAAPGVHVEPAYGTRYRVFKAGDPAYPLPGGPQRWRAARAGENPFPCPPLTEASAPTADSDRSECGRFRLASLNPLIPRSFEIAECTASPHVPPPPPPLTTTAVTPTNTSATASTSSAAAVSDAAALGGGAVVSSNGVTVSSAQPLCGGAPMVVRNDTRALVWLQQDVGERLPRVHVGAEVIFPRTLAFPDAEGRLWPLEMDSVEVKGMAMLWGALIEEMGVMLTSYGSSVQARFASLSSRRGLTLSMSAFTATMPELASRLSATLALLGVDGNGHSNGNGNGNSTTAAAAHASAPEPCVPGSPCHSAFSAALAVTAVSMQDSLFDMPFKELSVLMSELEGSLDLQSKRELLTFLDPANDVLKTVRWGAAAAAADAESSAARRGPFASPPTAADMGRFARGIATSGAFVEVYVHGAATVTHARAIGEMLSRAVQVAGGAGPAAFLLSEHPRLGVDPVVAAAAAPVPAAIVAAAGAATALTAATAESATSPASAPTTPPAPVRSVDLTTLAGTPMMLRGGRLMLCTEFPLPRRLKRPAQTAADLRPPISDTTATVVVKPEAYNMIRYRAPTYVASDPNSALLLSVQAAPPMPIGGGAVARALARAASGPASAATPGVSPSAVAASALGQHVLTEMAAELMKEACFHTLRTQQQLGYVVMCGTGVAGGPRTFNVMIQGAEPSHDPDLYYQRATAFLQDHFETMTALPASAFADAWREAAGRRDRERTAMRARFQDGWRQVTEHTYIWGRPELAAAAARALTPRDLLRHVALRVAPVSARTHAALARALARPELATVPSLSGSGDNNHRSTSDSSSNTTVSGAQLADAAYFPERRELTVGLYGGDKLARRLAAEAAEVSESAAAAEAAAAAAESAAGAESRRFDVPTPVSQPQLQAMHRRFGAWAAPDARTNAASSADADPDAIGLEEGTEAGGGGSSYYACRRA